MAKKIHISFFIFAMIGFIMMVSVSSTTTHIVGDHAGWSLPSCQEFYEDWAKKRTFAIGDVLRMCYPLNSIYPLKYDIIFFVTFWYTNADGRHCEVGLKLRVTVPQGKHPSH
ncbi:Cupredoxin [Sesbania bispinosa]|nr:Cupredoxin [Sesbania bispinosa]